MDKKQDNLKPEINNLLWMNLPSAITLKEMEIIALAIFELFLSARERYPEGES